MKLDLRRYLLIELIFTLSSLCSYNGFAEEPPVKYIFELSNEPIKVSPGKWDTSNVFFPKYSRGTTPESVKQQAALFLSHSQQAEPETPPSISIYMNDDKEATTGHVLIGYDFYRPNTQGDIIMSLESTDEEIWLNSGDPDSPFFNTPSPNPDSEEHLLPLTDKDEEVIHLHMNLPESSPHPFVIQPAPSGAIRTIIKSFDGINFEADEKSATPLHSVRDQLPPGYVPIPALPAYQPTILRKLR